MKLIPVASFSDSFQANIAKSKLEEEGIECTISNEDLVNTVWLSSDIVGGLKILVSSDDAEKAILILNETFDFNDETEFVENTDDGIVSDLICPYCGSRAVLQKLSPKMINFIFSFISFKKHDSWQVRYQCGKCGKKWNK